MSEPIRIAVIGAGQILKRHVLAYQSLKGAARLAAIADVDRRRAERAREQFRFAESSDDHRALLARDDIDAVDICTPAGTHTGIVLDALRAGKHVLCEKPLTTTLADADAIAREASAHPDKTVCCVYQLRHDATHVRMRRLIEQGQIGRPLFARVCVRVKKSPAYFSSAPGRGSWAMDGGGVVMNQAIHQIDALLWMLGDAVEVCARAETLVHPIEAEDTLIGWVRFKSGALATIECSTCAKKKEFMIDVTGENAGLRISGDPDSQKFNLRIDAAGSAASKAIERTGLRDVPQPKNPKGLVKAAQKLGAKIRRRPWTPPAHWGHAPLIGAFLEATRKGAPGPVPPGEARRSIELAMALYESARTGRIVSLPLDATSSVYNGIKQEGGVDTAPKSRPKRDVVSAAHDTPQPVKEEV